MLTEKHTKRKFSVTMKLKSLQKKAYRVIYCSQSSGVTDQTGEFHSLFPKPRKAHLSQAAQQESGGGGGGVLLVWERCRFKAKLQQQNTELQRSSERPERDSPEFLWPRNNSADYLKETFVTSNLRKTKQEETKMSQDEETAWCPLQLHLNAPEVSVLSWTRLKLRRKSRSSSSVASGLKTVTSTQSYFSNTNICRR